MVTQSDLEAARQAALQAEEVAADLAAQARKARDRARSARVRYDNLVLEHEGQLKLFDQEEG